MGGAGAGGWREEYGNYAGQITGLCVRMYLRMIVLCVSTACCVYVYCIVYVSVYVHVHVCSVYIIISTAVKNRWPPVSQPARGLDEAAAFSAVPLRASCHLRVALPCPLLAASPGLSQPSGHPSSHRLPGGKCAPVAPPAARTPPPAALAHHPRTSSPSRSPAASKPAVARFSFSPFRVPHRQHAWLSGLDSLAALCSLLSPLHHLPSSSLHLFWPRLSSPPRHSIQPSSPVPQVATVPFLRRLDRVTPPRQERTQQPTPFSKTNKISLFATSPLSSDKPLRILPSAACCVVEF